jgi:hypothetical protein
MLEKWTPAAYEVENPLQSLPAPFPVIVGEAIDVARFCETHWQPQVDGKGKEVVPGLVSAVRPGLFEPGIGQDILELQEAAQAANTAYLMTSQRGASAPMERALFVLGELRAVLTFLMDDDEEDIDDERLGNLAATYDSAASQDAIASALDDYAGFAEYHRESVAGLGGFEAGVIDEARTLAKDLRERSAQHLAGLPPGENKRALELRNRLAALLYDRMNQVRSVARFVFRRHPDLGAESDQRLSAAPPHCRQPRSPRIRNNRPSGHEPLRLGRNAEFLRRARFEREPRRRRVSPISGSQLGRSASAHVAPQRSLDTASVAAAEQVEVHQQR